MSFAKRLLSKIGVTDNLAAYGAEESTCRRPGANFRVDKPPPNDIVMHASPTLALVAGDMKYLEMGRWTLRKEERHELLKKMDVTGSRDTHQKNKDGDGTLDEHDFKTFCASEKNRRWVTETLPASAHALACHSLTKRAFEHFDKNNDKVLDLPEFLLFMDFIAQVRLRYLQQMSLVSFRAYWGRDQSEASNGGDTQCHVKNLVAHLKTKCDAELAKPGCQLRNSIQYGFPLVQDWKGWRADLYYYSANLHPLHGIWGCDANNRLERLDRLMMEVAVLFYIFWVQAERERWIDNGWSYPGPDWLLPDDTYYRWLLQTGPSMVLFYMLLFLFTTPRCGTVDESSAEPRVIKRARSITTAGDAIGNLLVIALIGGCIHRVCFHEDGFASNARLMSRCIFLSLYARANAYLCAWASYVGVYFNPFIAWGSTVPANEKQPLFALLGDLCGLGQWYIEYRKVWMTCAALESKGDLTQHIRTSSGADLPNQPLTAEKQSLPAMSGGQDAYFAGAFDSLDQKKKSDELARAESEEVKIQISYEQKITDAPTADETEI